MPTDAKTPPLVKPSAKTRAKAAAKTSAKTPTTTAGKTAAKPQAKTQATTASVADHLASRASGPLLADAQALMALLGRLTGEPATMWGPSIVGFGSYRYPLAGGRTGSACATGLAVRGKELVLYLMAEGPQQAQLLPRLGPHRMGKACLYVKRLADLDLGVLEQLVLDALDELRRRHPEGAA